MSNGDGIFWVLINIWFLLFMGLEPGCFQGPQHSTPTQENYRG